MSLHDSVHLADQVHDLALKTELLNELVISARQGLHGTFAEQRRAQIAISGADKAIELLRKADQVLRLGRPRALRLVPAAEIILATVAELDFQAASALLSSLLHGLQQRLSTTSSAQLRTELERSIQLASSAREDITRLQSLARRHGPTESRLQSTQKHPKAAVNLSTL